MRTYAPKLIPAGFLTSDQLAEAAGITYRQLNLWTHDGILTPLGDLNPGSGRPRLWPMDTVRMARVAGTLLRNIPSGYGYRRLGLLGIDWPALGALVRSHTAAGWLVITDDGTMSWTDSASDAAEWQTGSRLAVCVRVAAA